MSSADSEIGVDSSFNEAHLPLMAQLHALLPRTETTTRANPANIEFLSSSRDATRPPSPAYERIRDWLPVLSGLSIPVEQALRIAHRSIANATSFAEELLAAEIVPERDLYRAVAGEVGLPFVDRIDPGTLIMRESHRMAALRRRGGPSIAMIKRRDRPTAYVLAQTDLDIASLRRQLAQRPALATRLHIATPASLREAIIAQTRSRLLRDAQYDLFVRMPQFSARFAATAWHGVCAGALFVALPVGLALARDATLLAIHGTATLTFFCCVALRILALAAARPIVLPRIRPSDASELPVYSILVALYREKEVVPQLLVALGRINWPRSKLEIKLVCEADDRETIDLLKAHRLHPCIEIVEVPPGQPRTKPKALQYALPLCSGDYVVLYDAEDRPHPMQLMEAWQRFQASDETLACVQAPLVVTNGGASMISRMFAFEYAGLFRGMLPWLSQHNLILPLGGTSNHFRRDALVEVGGWDSHNITEDADLGLRFARFGYRAETISHPTFEDGPEKLKTWLLQRTRWFKGWIQTWLVHMRNPFQLLRDLGPASFLVTQILFLGMITSALVHPLLVATILYTAAKLLFTGSAESNETFLALVDVANIACGYGAFIAICAYTLSRFEKRGLWKVLLFTPVYWVMLSIAAWWALWEFYRRPHHWHKTPHRKARPVRIDPIGETPPHRG